MAKQRILQIGSLTGHTPADAEIAARYDVLQYWKATDAQAFLREHADSIEVIVTSANIGCKATKAVPAATVVILIAKKNPTK